MANIRELKRMRNNEKAKAYATKILDDCKTQNSGNEQKGRCIYKWNEVFPFGRYEMELLNVLSGGEFSCIRVFKINEEAWFIGKDICKFFGDTNHNRTISRVDDCDKQYIEIEDSMGRKQNAIAVNESGMYSILFSMQPQKANNGGGTDAYPIEIQQRIEKLKRFKHWVTSEVLPSIRKHGVYAVDELLNNPDMAIKAFTALKEEREKNKFLQAENQRMKPKEVFADAVSARSHFHPDRRPFEDS